MDQSLHTFPHLHTQCHRSRLSSLKSVVVAAASSHTSASMSQKPCLCDACIIVLAGVCDQVPFDSDCLLCGHIPQSDLMFQPFHKGSA
ncbi:hypothetical protein BaRGS_00015377 [Batillaria attramentaria]|uniref:Uncharacterized protein n=1 Tax=Batillaria attramentaria TaxID=370345 RepID=A0ABD0L268_9CAEN